MPNFIDNLDVIDATNTPVNVLLQDRNTLALATKIMNGEVIINAAAYDILPNNDITTALTDLFNTYKYIYLPEGTYTINGLTIPNGCGLIGNNATIASTSNPCIRLNSNSFIDGLSIVNTSDYQYSNCIDTAYEAENITISNCNIQGCYIQVYLNHAKRTRIYNCDIKNEFTNGLCIYGYYCDSCAIEKCDVFGNYTDGSHSIQFSNGVYNSVELCHVKQAFNFNISFYNEKFGCIKNNYCEESRVEGINLDNSDQCEVSGNSCIFTNTDFPTLDHGITVYGSTKSANYNHIHHNLVVGAYKAGIAIAGIAGFNTIDANIIRDTNHETDPNGIKGAITIYKDASDPQTAPFNNMICNNSISVAPYYAIEERDGYQNVIIGNISKPVVPNYLTNPIYQICDDVCITAITPGPTISTTGTVTSHEEYWQGEFVVGTFTVEATINQSFTYSIGITPDPNSLFEAHVNGGADCPISMDGAGLMTIVPNFSGTVSINYKYRAQKYFL